MCCDSYDNFTPVAPPIRCANWPVLTKNFSKLAAGRGAYFQGMHIFMGCQQMHVMSGNVDLSGNGLDVIR